jgi:glycosyltransferase involved in cell wall biosynthesis
VAEKRPTILQIIPDLDTGGAELATVEIADAVTRAGGRALVLTQGGRLASKLEAAGGEFMRFPAATKNPARIVLNAGRIAAIARAEGVDLIHARSRAPAWSGLLAARRVRVPFVTTYHGAYNEKGRLKNWYNSVMARGDVVIANSQYTADLIRQRYGTSADRLTVIYRGVDGVEFDPRAVSERRVAEMRSRWGLKPGERAIVHAARLTGWKGQSVVIEAARLLRDKGVHGKWAVILAGDDQGRIAYSDALETQIFKADLGEHVRLVGHVSDMAAAFAAAHLAVVASTEPEAFGRAATEAQVMGCPVIATRLGAPPETVLAPPRVRGEQATGWLVPPGDATALAAAIDEALGLDDSARAAMGARARSHVLHSFSLRQMKQQTLDVYDGLLGTSLRRRFDGTAAKG